MKKFSFELTKKIVVTVEATSAGRAALTLDDQDVRGEMDDMWHRAEAQVEFLCEAEPMPVLIHVGAEQ